MSMYTPFINPYADSIGALLARQNDPAARAKEIGGQAWGHAIEQAGQMGAGVVTAIGHEQQQAAVKKASRAQDDAFMHLLGQGHLPDARAVMQIYGPERGAKIADSIAAFSALESKQTADARADVGRVATGIKAFGPQIQAAMWPAFRQKVIEIGLLPDADMPEALDASALDGVIALATGKEPAKPEQPKTREVVIRNPDGTTTTKIVEDKPGQDFSSAAPAPTPAPSQTHNMRLKGVGDVPVDYVPNKDGTGGKWMYQGKDVTGDVTAIPAASVTIRNEKEAAGKDNRAELAEMVRTGLMSPAMLSKRTDDYNDIIATASRKNKEETGKPLNLAKLQLDYDAAHKWVLGQNAPQMIRFKGLATSVVNTIDEVKRLGDELKQGGIQKWNSVSRKTIQQLYGNTPQAEVANRYMVAVNTLKEEFANLANGGYAPTDAAWGLANQQINGDMGFKDLGASLSEVQRLINYRVSAFDDVAPTTFGGPPANAPAAPAAPASDAGWTTVNGIRIREKQP